MLRFKEARGTKEWFIVIPVSRRVAEYVPNL
jgi:hypothetical protein